MEFDLRVLERNGVQLRDRGGPPRWEKACLDALEEVPPGEPEAPRRRVSQPKRQGGLNGYPEGKIPDSTRIACG